MKRVKPWVTGAAFSAVTAAVYIACALAVLLFPDGFLTFANNWAHGIDLTLIKRPASTPVAFNHWAAGFASAVGAGFLVGAIYGWARNFFAGVSEGRLTGHYGTRSRDTNPYTSTRS